MVNSECLCVFCSILFFWPKYIIAKGTLRHILSAHCASLNMSIVKILSSVRSQMNVKTRLLFLTWESTRISAPLTATMNTNELHWFSYWISHSFTPLTDWISGDLGIVPREMQQTRKTSLTLSETWKIKYGNGRLWNLTFKELKEKHKLLTVKQTTAQMFVYMYF